MERIRTKEAAESALRELPSVLGAFVREDIRGHPREVHILIGPAPNTRDLARDVRGLLEERLGIRIDQRIISIAQLVRPLDPPGDDAIRAGAVEPAGHETRSDPETPSVLETSPTAEPSPVAEAPTVAASAAPAARAAEPRLVLERIESHAVDGRVQVAVRLGTGELRFEGRYGGMDGGTGRIRAAAEATLAAVMEASGGTLRLETARARTVSALGREYVVVGVVASSERLGRRLLPLLGAHPIDDAEEDAASLATLHAVNRVAAAHASLVTRQRRA